MKDIFIDNNVAKNFATPIDTNYKSLIAWINNYDEALVKLEPEKKKNYAHLVVSQKLLVEYLNSSKDCSKPNAIPSIVNRLTREGRLLKKTKIEIETLISNTFSKKTIKNLLSNSEDHIHIATVILSERKLCLTYDDNLTADLQNFPGFNIIVKKRPEDLNYQ